MAKVLAVWELLQSVALLVIREADETAHNSVVYVGVSICDHTHFYEVSRVNALLDHIVDAVLTESLHRGLVLLNGLLDIGERAIIHLTCHLLIMIDPPQQLQRGFLD